MKDEHQNTYSKQLFSPDRHLGQPANISLKADYNSLCRYAYSVLQIYKLLDLCIVEHIFIHCFAT